MHSVLTLFFFLTTLAGAVDPSAEVARLAAEVRGKDPAGIFLFDQLVRYALGPDFTPEASLPEEALKGKATK